VVEGLNAYAGEFVQVANSVANGGAAHGEWHALQGLGIKFNPDSTDPRTKPDEPFTYIDLTAVDRGVMTPSDPILGRQAPSRARRVVNIDLTGRSALVTGSTRGIGRAIADTLSRCGARVAVVGREKVRADEGATQLSDSARGFACHLLSLISI